MQADLERHGIDCRLELAGDLIAILEPYQEAWIEDEVALLRRFGHDVEVFDGPAMRAEVASPTYRAGIWDRTGAGLLDPGRLADGLRAAAQRAGVRIFERTRAEALEPRAAATASTWRAGGGRVRARGALLATSAFPPLLRAIRRYIVPVYDYALVTEPLSAAQRDAIGWRRRQGLSDGANQFHYYRLTPDDRILFGGYDAVYRFRGPVDPVHDDDEHSFARLSAHFFHTFPQLEGLRFAYRWGGAIDTSSRFSVFFGTALGGRVAYAVGYTGLGVGATRFGARVALDLLDGRETEATRLRYVRTPAGAVPAGAAAVGGRAVHAQPPGRGRPAGRAARAVAADARPARARVRQLRRRRVAATGPSGGGP